MRISAEQLQVKLEHQGLVFSVLTLTQEGQFSESDADWNYKDIPHLNEVHKLVEAVPAIIEHDLISNYFLQRLGPFRIPLSITNYSATKNSQVYFTSAFFFVLVIETNWLAIDETSTRVTTTYRIGSQRILRPLHRVISALLRKNYKVLMDEDVPMRLQRGKLRSRGLRFKGDDEGYSFLRTLNVHADNVLVPALQDKAVDEKVRLDSIPSGPGRKLIGSDDHRGLQLTKHSELIYAFPRICPHEGASLDGAEMTICSKPSIRCPWHGRAILGIEVTSQEPQELKGVKLHRLQDEVEITWE